MEWSLAFNRHSRLFIIEPFESYKSRNQALLECAPDYILIENYPSRDAAINGMESFVRAKGLVFRDGKFERK
jgi:hypothetical protein